jgi:hypothetical protein
VYAVKKTVVKPMQHATVTLRAAEVEQKTMPAGDCVLTGSIKFMDTTNLHPWIDALTKVGEDVIYKLRLPLTLYLKLQYK